MHSGREKGVGKEGKEAVKPRLAATFCMTKTNAVYFVLPHDDSTSQPSGKNVISAISFAMIIEPK